MTPEQVTDEMILAWRRVWDEAPGTYATGVRDAIAAAINASGCVLVPRTVPDAFAEWMLRELPSGSVIGRPEWWAPKIYRAMLYASETTAAASSERETGHE